jgi:hypothetical protein
VISIGLDWSQIVADWECLERTVLPILGSLDNEDDLEKFILNKIEGFLAAAVQNEGGTEKGQQNSGAADPDEEA